MSEKLVIRNFGPIQSLDLDLRKANVLIGEQASGKSTVAKILAICRYFSYIVHEESFMNGLISWGIDGYVREGKSYVFYENEDYSFEVDYKLKIHKYVSKSQRFKDLIAEFDVLFRHNQLMRQLPPSFFQNYVAKVMQNPFYLPTERGLQSIFSLGKSTIQNMSDSLFNQFAKLDLISSGFNRETVIEPLGITYINNDSGLGMVKDSHESYYSIKHAASGYQSTIPLVLLLKYYSERKKKAKSFIIEEPEMNLFPKAQKVLMEFLVSQVNEYGHSLLLNTHSPYILTALDNMMYAYKVGHLAEGKHATEVQKIVDKKYWMNPEEVAIYCLKDGKAELILDREEAISDKDYLDGVSDILGTQFDRLLNLELKGEERQS